VTARLTKVVVERVDDLDSTVSDDISTISFGLDRAEYEIDRTEGNTPLGCGMSWPPMCRSAPDGWADQAGTSSVGTSRAAADRTSTTAIRQRATGHGYELAERGRIPADVIAAYAETQINAAKPTARRKRKKTGEAAFN
jgi:hypothetical protein